MRISAGFLRSIWFSPSATFAHKKHPKKRWCDSENGGSPGVRISERLQPESKNDKRLPDFVCKELLLPKWVNTGELFGYLKLHSNSSCNDIRCSRISCGVMSYIIMNHFFYRYFLGYDIQIILNVIPGHIHSEPLTDSKFKDISDQNPPISVVKVS